MWNLIILKSSNDSWIKSSGTNSDYLKCSFKNAGDLYFIAGRTARDITFMNDLDNPRQIQLTLDVINKRIYGAYFNGTSWNIKNILNW